VFVQGADWILNLNAPRHSRIRSLIARAFTAQRIAGLEGFRPVANWRPGGALSHAATC
jgi:cytochrome P450